MKRLSIVFILLTACTSVERSPDEVPPSVVKDEFHTQQEIPLPLYSIEMEHQTQAQEQAYLPISDWLQQRQGICAQSQEAISAQLQKHQQDFPVDPKNTDITDPGAIYSQLRTLMLVSCDPARTPGLFHEAIAHAAKVSHWSDDYQALFALMASQLDAYEALERQFHELEERHQKTIEGIGNIERSLGSQTEPDG